MAVLGWFELPEEDRPPERIWLDGEALSDHFEGVKSRYDAKSQGMEPIEDDDMMQSELTQGLRR